MNTAQVVQQPTAGTLTNLVHTPGFMPHANHEASTLRSLGMLPNASASMVSGYIHQLLSSSLMT
jgi:hypothetical protein